MTKIITLNLTIIHILYILMHIHALKFHCVIEFDDIFEFGHNAYNKFILWKVKSIQEFEWIMTKQLSLIINRIFNKCLISLWFQRCVFILILFLFFKLLVSECKSDWKEVSSFTSLFIQFQGKFMQTYAIMTTTTTTLYGEWLMCVLYFGVSWFKQYGVRCR